MRIICRLGAGPRGLLSYIRRGVCRFAGRSPFSVPLRSLYYLWFQLAAMGVSRVCLVLLLVGLSLCSPAFSYSHHLWKRQNGAMCDPTPANLRQSFETNCTGLEVDNATCDRAWMAFTRAFARRNPTTVMARLVSSLASQTLTLHSVLVLSGKTRGGRVWPTAYTRLDPARQDVVWPIRFVENMITSRSMFTLRIAGERRDFLEVDLPFGHFLVSKK